jgi:hypothetical protein
MLIAAHGVGFPVWAQPSSPAVERVSVLVTETAGIRRFFYPVHARVPFSAGQLSPTESARLRRDHDDHDDDAEVPSQISAESHWPDGSVQWLSVHFNTSIGPGESQTYQVEYGSGIEVSGARPRGLTLVEAGDGGLQVGSLRLSRRGEPLVASVAYRDEAIGEGRNGFRATGRGGEIYRLTASPDLEILKDGPLYVELRYSGQLVSEAGATVPVVVTVGMPNSKSWIKMQATVDDPAARVRELSLDLPFALGPHPWVWDFGTERWTYGSLRGERETVELTNVVTVPAPSSSSSSAWEVRLQTDGRDQLYESGQSVVGGWGHLQSGGEVVAFGMEGFGTQPGTYRVTLGGSGQTTFAFTPSRPTREHRLIVYNHYVSNPVQIGAATSPSSMLNPLRVVCDRERYVAAGLEPPTP